MQSNAPKPALGLISRSWRHAGLALQTTEPEFRQQLQDLLDLAGSQRAAAGLLGLPMLTLRHWMEAKPPPIAGRRLVWLTWCLLLHPEKIHTAFDLTTWGRFHVQQLDPPKEPYNPPGGRWDWSI